MRMDTIRWVRDISGELHLLLTPTINNNVQKRLPVRDRGTVHSADLGTSSKESY